MLQYNKDANVRLTAQEVRYWKRIFKSNLKIGVEIETNFDNSANRTHIIQQLRSQFPPSDSVARFGQAGVYAIKGDGSLQNGVELCTVGRRLEFIDLYMQYRGILTKMFEFDPIMNERAGLHNHVLLDYSDDGTCLEKPVPGVIMKNFLQLLRRHLPELVWITSTVKGTNAITRYDNFCKSENIRSFTPLKRTISEFRNNSGGHDRYQFINMAPFQANGDSISRFHFELRFPDGSIWGAQIAAQNILYSAMLIKAIELSENGIITTGSAEEWDVTKQLFQAIRNSQESGFGNNRTSRMPTNEQIDMIQERALNMVKELKPQIDQHDKHVYVVLKMLAEKPISIMRRTMRDAEINDMFDNVIKSMYNVDMSDCSRVTKLINTMEINDASNQNQWITKVAEKLELTPTEVSNKLFKISQVQNIKFDAEMGSVVFTN